MEKDLNLVERVEREQEKVDLDLVGRIKEEQKKCYAAFEKLWEGYSKLIRGVEWYEKRNSIIQFFYRHFIIKRRFSKIEKDANYYTCIYLALEEARKVALKGANEEACNEVFEAILVYNEGLKNLDFLLENMEDKDKPGFYNVRKRLKEKLVENKLYRMTLNDLGYLQIRKSA